MTICKGKNENNKWKKCLVFFSVLRNGNEMPKKLRGVYKRGETHKSWTKIAIFPIYIISIFILWT